MFNHNNIKSTVITLFILYYLVISIISISKPMIPIYDGMGDAIVRIMEIKVHKSIPKYGSWMSLPYYLISLSLKIYDNIYISPRIMATFTSLILMGIIYIWSKQITKSETGSLIVLSLWLFSPFFSAYFTYPLTEPLFALLWITGFILLEAKHVRYRNITASIFFALASCVRYEGWYLIPIVLGYLRIIKKWKKQNILLFIMINLIYPIYWIYNNYLYTNDPFFFISDKILWARLDTNYIIYSPTRSIKWIYKVLNHLGIVSIGILIYNLMFSIFKKRDKRSLFLLCTSTFLVIMLILQTYFGTMEWFPDQYLYLPILLTLPLISKGFLRLIHHPRSRFNVALSILLITSVVVPRIVYCFDRIKKIPTKNANTIIDYISHNNEAPTAILFTKTKRPTDLDYLMYFAQQYHYNGYEITNNLDVCNMYHNPQYKTYINYSTSESDINLIHTCCEHCHIISNDDKLLIIK